MAVSLETLWERIMLAVPAADIYWVIPFQSMNVRVPYAEALRVRALLERATEFGTESCGAVSARNAKGEVLVLVDSIPAWVGAVALAEHVVDGGECTPEVLSGAWEGSAAAMRVGQPLEPSSGQVRLLAEMLIERVESAGGGNQVTTAWLEVAGDELRAEPSIAAAARMLAEDRPVRVERARPPGAPAGIDR